MESMEPPSTSSPTPPAAAGDSEQLRAHMDKVYSFAYYYLGNREDAEDVAQEVLIRYWNHRSKLEADGTPAWLNRVTRNACFDQLRRRKTRRAVLDQDGDAKAERAPSTGLDPERRATGNDFQRHLKRALTAVPEPYRSVVILREIQDLKYGEIAGRLEMPLNTVKTYLHRGRRQLRELLREVYDHEERDPGRPLAVTAL